MHQKLVPDLWKIFAKSQNVVNTFNKIIFKLDILTKGYQKSSKNLASFLFLNFTMKSKRSLGLVTLLPNIFAKHISFFNDPLPGQFQCFRCKFFSYSENYN